MWNLPFPVRDRSLHYGSRYGSRFAMSQLLKEAYKFSKDLSGVVSGGDIVQGLNKNQRQKNERRK